MAKQSNKKSRTCFISTLVKLLISETKKKSFNFDTTKLITEMF